MAASRLKTLILITLLLVNIFLAALVIPARLGEQRQHQAADARLAELFADAGISLDPTIIPRQRLQQPLVLRTDEEFRAAVAADILGEGAQREENVGGIIYSTEQGYVRFQDAAFSALLPAGAERSEAEAQRLVARLGMTATSAGSYNAEGTLVCTLIPETLGFSVVSAPITVRFDEEAHVILEGTLLPESALLRTGAVSTCSARDALVAFLESRLNTGWLGSEITAIAQCWRTERSGGEVRLLPVWRISTDIGAYTVDCESRGISAL
jgi:hypothetical protein